MSLNGYKIILASSSPRRIEYLKQMKISFSIKKIKYNENFDKNLKGHLIPRFIVKKKAESFINKIKDKQIIITADTIVWHKNKCLEKPKNNKEAMKMLIQLSNEIHKVITAVGFLTKNSLEIIHKTTKVKFGKISKEDLSNYINKDKPFDKAGSYGIQDWFGLVAVESINGSYSNIVGLPTHEVYNKIKEITSKK